MVHPLIIQGGMGVAVSGWPLARAVDTDLFLRAGDRLAFDAPEAEEETDTFTYDPADPVQNALGTLQMPQLRMYLQRKKAALEKLQQKLR